MTTRKVTPEQALEDLRRAVSDFKVYGRNTGMLVDDPRGLGTVRISHAEVQRMMTLAISMAEGVELLDNYLSEGGLPPDQWRQKK